MTEIKFTPTSPEAQQCEWIFNFVGEVERISIELSEPELQAIIDGFSELQAIIDGFRAELTEPAPADARFSQPRDIAG